MRKDDHLSTHSARLGFSIGQTPEYLSPSLALEAPVETFSLAESP